MDKILEIKDLNKYYGNNHVLKDVSFSMNKGEVIAIIGSSGGGKSTLLRCLTFLEKAQSGTIDIDGERIVENTEIKVKIRKKAPLLPPPLLNDDNYCKETKKEYKSVYPKDKILRQKALKMGLVFQDFNLFPHLTVLENLTLAPIKVKKTDKKTAEQIAIDNLEKVGLLDKKDAYPCDISGGQKQRAAIARALCMEPEILCFDEPTSALDPELTGEVLKVIGELKKSEVTMLIVTHEIMFAREIADKVIFLDKGIILETGLAKDVIDNPKENRTKEFMEKILKA